LSPVAKTQNERPPSGRSQSDLASNPKSDFWHQPSDGYHFHTQFWCFDKTTIASATKSQEVTQTSAFAVIGIGRSLMRLDDRASITFLDRAFTAADHVGGTDSAQWRKAMGHSAMDRACHELRL
jgi:hypothetical protein